MVYHQHRLRCFLPLLLLVVCICGGCATSKVLSIGHHMEGVTDFEEAFVTRDGSLAVVGHVTQPICPEAMQERVVLLTPEQVRQILARVSTRRPAQKDSESDVRLSDSMQAEIVTKGVGPPGLRQSPHLLDGATRVWQKSDTPNSPASVRFPYAYAAVQGEVPFSLYRSRGVDYREPLSVPVVCLLLPPAIAIDIVLSPLEFPLAVLQAITFKDG